MPSMYRCVLDQRTLSADSTFDLGDALDLCDYATLEIVVTVHAAGSGTSPSLEIQHAPVNDRDRYLAFDTPVSIDLTVATTTWIHVSAFTRFVGWVLSGTLSSDAVVTVEIIAKG